MSQMGSSKGIIQSQHLILIKNYLQQEVRIPFPPTTQRNPNQL